MILLSFGISSYRLLNTATTKPAFATEDIRNAAGINNRQFFGAAKDINNVSPAKSQMEVFKTNSCPRLSLILPHKPRSTIWGRDMIIYIAVTVL